MEQIWAPLFGFFGVIVTVVVPLVWANRRTERRLREEIAVSAGITQSQLGNGVKQVVADIHRDLTLTVMPELAEAKKFREGYRGTIWSDNDAIQDWLKTLDDRFNQIQRRLDDHIHEQVGQIDDLRKGIDGCSVQITDHDEWERSQKIYND